MRDTTIIVPCVPAAGYGDTGRRYVPDGWDRLTHRGGSHEGFGGTSAVFLCV